MIDCHPTTPCVGNVRILIRAAHVIRMNAIRLNLKKPFVDFSAIQNHFNKVPLWWHLINIHLPHGERPATSVAEGALFSNPHTCQYHRLGQSPLQVGDSTLPPEQNNTSSQHLQYMSIPEALQLCSIAIEIIIAIVAVVIAAKKQKPFGWLIARLLRCT